MGKPKVGSPFKVLNLKKKLVSNYKKKNYFFDFPLLCYKCKITCKLSQILFLFFYKNRLWRKSTRVKNNEKFIYRYLFQSAEISNHAWLQRGGPEQASFLSNPASQRISLEAVALAKCGQRRSYVLYFGTVGGRTRPGATPCRANDKGLTEIYGKFHLEFQLFLLLKCANSNRR